MKGLLGDTDEQRNRLQAEDWQFSTIGFLRDLLIYVWSLLLLMLKYMVKEFAMSLSQTDLAVNPNPAERAKYDFASNSIYMPLFASDIEREFHEWRVICASNKFPNNISALVDFASCWYILRVLIWFIAGATRDYPLVMTLAVIWILVCLLVFFRKFILRILRPFGIHIIHLWNLLATFFMIAISLCFVFIFIDCHRADDIDGNSFSFSACKIAKIQPLDNFNDFQHWHVGSWTGKICWGILIGSFNTSHCAWAFFLPWPWTLIEAVACLFIYIALLMKIKFLFSTAIYKILWAVFIHSTAAVIVMLYRSEYATRNMFSVMKNNAHHIEYMGINTQQCWGELKNHLTRFRCWEDVVNSVLFQHYLSTGSVLTYYQHSSTQY